MERCPKILMVTIFKPCTDCLKGLMEVVEIDGVIAVILIFICIDIP